MENRRCVAEFEARVPPSMSDPADLELQAQPLLCSQRASEPRRAAAPAHFPIAASQFWISTTRASSPGSGSALRVISSRPSAATSNDVNDARAPDPQRGPPMAHRW